MELYPAIDLREGKCVRLVQGDYARETVYRGDPVAVADEFEAAGAPWLHVVDLDAARTGRPVNRDVVAAIVDAVGIPVQYGGGIRDDFSAEALLELGVARVVIGTKALEDPGLVRRLARRHPAQVAVGLDGRSGQLALRGWTERASLTLDDALAGLADAGRVVKGVNFENLRDAGDPAELAALYDAQGADEVVFLDITASSDQRDTMVEVVRRTADQVFIPLTVGGGVRTVEDGRQLLR